MEIDPQTASEGIQGNLEAKLLKEFLSHYRLPHTQELKEKLSQAAIYATYGSALQEEIKALLVQQSELKRQSREVQRAWLKEQGYNHLADKVEAAFMAQEWIQGQQRKARSLQKLTECGLKEGQWVVMHNWPWGKIDPKTTENLNLPEGKKRYGVLAIVDLDNHHQLTTTKERPPLGSLIVRLANGKRAGKRWEFFDTWWIAAAQP